MNTCDYKHPLIVHDERNCPLCEALDTIAANVEDIKILTNLVEKLTEQTEYLATTYEPESLL
jgi:hypothetical protein